MVQDVWYFRENAGIAELFGTDPSITKKTATTPAKPPKMLVLTTRLFIRLSSKSRLLNYKARVTELTPACFNEVHSGRSRADVP